MPEDQPSSLLDRIKNPLSVIVAAAGLVSWLIGDIPRVVRLALGALVAGFLIFGYARVRPRLLYASLPILVLVSLGLVPATRGWILADQIGQASTAGKGPLAVDVIADPGTSLESSAYDPWWLLPQGAPGPSEIPPDLDPVAGPEFWRWAANNGAIRAHHTMFRIVLRGKSQDPVLVTGLRAHVIERGDPVPGWYTPTGVCGAVPVRSVDVDLDASPPKLVFSGGSADDPERPARSMTLELRRGQAPEVIEVFASTERYTVTWYAELIYQVGGEKERSIRIDNAGEPFRVTAVTRESSLAYRASTTNEGEVSLQRQSDLDGQSGIC